MYRVRSAWTLSGAVALAIAAFPSPGAAQASAVTVVGTWDACFRVDSANRARTEANALCLALTFDPAPYCGQPTVAYVLADYWPYRQGTPTDTTRVHYQVVGDSLDFGGRVTRRASAAGEPIERCTISRDDGSLFGTGAIAADSVTGRWGTMSFGSAGPIGTFVLRRR